VAAKVQPGQLVQHMAAGAQLCGGGSILHRLHCRSPTSNAKQETSTQPIKAVASPSQLMELRSRKSKTKQKTKNKYIYIYVCRHAPHALPKVGKSKIQLKSSSAETKFV